MDDRQFYDRQNSDENELVMTRYLRLTHPWFAVYIGALLQTCGVMVYVVL